MIDVTAVARRILSGRRGATLVSLDELSALAHSVLGIEPSAEVAAPAPDASPPQHFPHRAAIAAEARARGFTGDSCTTCGNWTMVRNGTCLKCTTCGSTTGCS